MSIELNVIDDQPVSLETSGEQISLCSTTPQVDGVISVNGKQGVVVLTAEDIGVTGVPSNVRQAMLTLFENAAYATTGLTDEIAIVESWAEQVTSLSISPTTLSLNGSTPQSITATVVPSGSTVTWSSSDSSIATVVGGVVTGVSNGSCTITASAGDLSATCSVAVSGFATLESISAVYTQSGTVYDTDSLDSLKADLVVTATYSDSSTETVPSTDYVLSGTLAEGTSTITVSYGGKTTTFNVTVTEFVILYPLTDRNVTVSGNTLEISNGNHVKYTVTSSQYGFVNITSGEISSNANIVNNLASWFTIPANVPVILTLSNMTNSGATDLSTNFRLASASTSASFSTSGTSGGERVVQKTLSSAENVSCFFLFSNSFKVGTIEFDITLTVDGVRYI